jgi:hypothetical protein
MQSHAQIQKHSARLYCACSHVLPRLRTETSEALPKQPNNEGPKSPRYTPSSIYLETGRRVSLREVGQLGLQVAEERSPLKLERLALTCVTVTVPVTL